MFTLALAAVSLLVPQASSGDIIHVVAFVEVFTTQVTCEDMRHDPQWSDAPSGEFEIRDSAERLLGAGHLDTGLQTPTSCIFSTELDAHIAPDGLYQAGIKGSEVDPARFDEEHFVNGMLLASMSGNDMNNDRVPDNEEGNVQVGEYQRANRTWPVSEYQRAFRSLTAASGSYCESFFDVGVTDSDIEAVFSGELLVARHVLDDHCTPLAPLFEQDSAEDEVSAAELDQLLSRAGLCLGA